MSCVDLFLNTESGTLNHVGASVTAETKSSQTGEPDVVASDADDF